MKKITPVNEKLHLVTGDEYYRREKLIANEEYWKYRRNWKIYPENKIVDIPLNIDIEVTNACNLQCVMCPRTIYGLRNQGYMEEDVFRKIVDEAAIMGVPAIKLVWRGEPTLHKKLPDFIRYAKKKGIIDVLINTNATILDENISRALIEAGLDKIIFSVDSPYADAYEEIRKGANFDNVIRNIKRFAEIREEMNSITPLTRATMILLNTDTNIMEDYKKIFGEIVDIITYTDYFDINNDKSDAILDAEKYNSFCCPMLWQRLLVAWDGRCYLCCRDETESYLVGDVRKQSLTEIWNSSELNRARDKHMNGSWKKINACRVCQKSISPDDMRGDGLV